MLVLRVIFNLVGIDTTQIIVCITTLGKEVTLSDINNTWILC